MEQYRYSSGEKKLREEADYYRRGNRWLWLIIGVLVLVVIGLTCTGCYSDDQLKADLAPVVNDAWAASGLKVEKAKVGEPMTEEDISFFKNNFKWWDELRGLIRNEPAPAAPMEPR